MSLEGQATKVDDVRMFITSNEIMNVFCFQIPFPAFTLIADVNDGDSESNYKEMKENSKVGKHFRWKRNSDDYQILLA